MTDNFTFEEQRTKLTAFAQPRGMVGFLMKHLGIRDERTANAILVAVAVIIFIISGFIFASALRV